MTFGVYTGAALLRGKILPVCHELPRHGPIKGRSWQSWHHHMALVMMAMLFMLEVKMEQHQDVSLLPTADVVALLAHYPPRRDLDEE